MGTIMRNNVVYGNTSSIIELSMADYEAREAAGGVDSDVLYFIPDADEYNNMSVNTNIADFFSITKDYVVGDLCIFNNQLYEFIADKPAGSWDESVVKQTTIKEKLDGLNTNMNNYLPLSGGIITGELTIANEIDGGMLMAKHSSGTALNVLSVGRTNNLGIGAGLFNAGTGYVNIYAGDGIGFHLPLGDGNSRLVSFEANDSVQSLYPVPSDTIHLGTSSMKWHTLYAKTGTINTSDEREKENIIPMKENTIMTFDRDGSSQEVDIYSELFDRLEPVEYNFINNTDGRTCFGLVAQQVISAMKEVGFEENDLDLAHHDYYTDEETGEEKDTYGLNYNNLIALLIHEVQKLKEEVASLKAE